MTIEDTEKSYKIVVTPDDGSEPQSYTVLRRAASKLQNGDHVQVGDQLATGSVDPKEVLRIRGLVRLEAPGERGSGRVQVAGCGNPRQAR